MYLYDTKERLLNEFSQLHGIYPAIQVEDVTFTSPNVWLQNGCNARVTITAKPTSTKVKGSVVIYYNRFRVDDALCNIVLPGKPGDYSTTHDVVKMLREIYQIPAYEEDFFLVNILATATTITLTPRIDALGWLPPHPVNLVFGT